jgi:four helix bundle protein
MKKHNFRELNIWKDSMNLVRKIYAISALLPAEERFGFISQINRCSVSIPSNIAEGSGRSSNKEFMRFLEIAISSSYELETQLILLKDIFQLELEQILNELTLLQNKIGAFMRVIKNEIELNNK